MRIRGGPKTAATSKMEAFVMIVNGSKFRPAGCDLPVM